MLRGELAVECLSNGNLEVVLHCAICLCDCRLLAPRACETAGHPSSEEMWRWHGEEPVSSVVGHSPPHHSTLPMHLSLFSLLTMTSVLYSCHQPPPPASRWDDGLKGPSLQLPPLGWLLNQHKLYLQGCNSPAGIYSFSWLLWASLSVGVIVGPLRKDLDK